MTDTRSTAHRMIAANGQTVTLTRKASGTYDPATSQAPITPSTQTGKGVILPLRPMSKANASNIVAGDQQLLLSALADDGSPLSVPHVDDIVGLPNGDTLALIAVEPLNPKGLDLLYDCVVRRHP